MTITFIDTHISPVSDWCPFIASNLFFSLFHLHGVKMETFSRQKKKKNISTNHGSILDGNRMSYRINKWPAENDHWFKQYCDVNLSVSVCIIFVRFSLCIVNSNLMTSTMHFMSGTCSTLHCTCGMYPRMKIIYFLILYINTVHIWWEKKVHEENTLWNKTQQPPADCVFNGVLIV